MHVEIPKAEQPVVHAHRIDRHRPADRRKEKRRLLARVDARLPLRALRLELALDLFGIVGRRVEPRALGVELRLEEPAQQPFRATFEEKRRGVFGHDVAEKIVLAMRVVQPRVAADCERVLRIGGREQELLRDRQREQRDRDPFPPRKRDDEPEREKRNARHEIARPGRVAAVVAVEARIHKKEERENREAEARFGHPFFFHEPDADARDARDEHRAQPENAAIRRDGENARYVNEVARRLGGRGQHEHPERAAVVLEDGVLEVVCDLERRAEIHGVIPAEHDRERNAAHGKQRPTPPIPARNSMH